MADSTEDLKREMEAFERGELDESGSVAPVESELARSPKRTIPSWIYLVILGDAIILVGVLVYFML